MWISQAKYDRLKNNINELKAAEEARGWQDLLEKKESGIYKNSLEKTQNMLEMVLTKKNMTMKNYTIYGLKSKKYWNVKAAGYEHGTCLSAGGESTRFFDTEDNTVFEANELIDIHVNEE